MTAEERKQFTNELLKSGMTMRQIERYAASNCRLGPGEWLEMLRDIQEETNGDGADGDQDGGVTDKQVAEWLDGKFPKEEDE
jgi:hypothetical protein